MVDPIADVEMAIEQFTTVATHDPVSAVLLASGALFVGLASAVFGYLTLGALVDLITPEASVRGPPRQG